MVGSPNSAAEICTLTSLSLFVNDDSYGSLEPLGSTCWLLNQIQSLASSLEWKLSFRSETI